MSPAHSILPGSPRDLDRRPDALNTRRELDPQPDR